MKVGDIVTLVPKNSLQPEKYRSMIVELNEDSIFIDYPVNLSTKRTAFLIDGTQLKVTYITADGTVYLFDTEVLGKVKASIPMIKLFNPNKNTHIKIQRRQYVRIETKADVAVHSKHYEFKPFTTVTEDISAGGAAILTPKGFSIEAGRIVTLLLVLPLRSGEFHYLTLDSEVIRLIDIEDKQFNLLTLKFTDISSADRQALIRFCFERQLELRDKGF